MHIWVPLVLRHKQVILFIHKGEETGILA
jgi:hypothetical protein